MKDSPVSSTVDFEKDGIQHGFLKLPHSHDDSAWGSIIIPITVAKNGVGPTILFTGAKTTNQLYFNSLLDGEIIMHDKNGKYIKGSRRRGCKIHSREQRR